MLEPAKTQAFVAALRATRPRVYEAIEKRQVGAASREGGAS
jgi:hypothetical protein